MTGDEARRRDELDRTWDAVLFGELVPSAGRIDAHPSDPDPTSTVRRLHARDDAPPPDPTFLRTLREDLMHLHATTHPSPPLGLPGRTTANHRLAVGGIPGRLVRPLPSPRPLTRAVETIAAAVLILTIVVGGFAGRHLLSDRSPTATIDAPGFAAHQSNAALRNVPMLGADPGRTGAHPGPGPRGEPGVRWRAAVKGGASSPVVVDGVVYVAGFNVAAFDAATGAEIWTAEVFGAVSVPTVVDGVVYVAVVFNSESADSRGVLLALDADTGEERWQASTDAYGGASPIVVDGVAYAAGDAAVYAFEAATGRQRWHLQLPSNRCTCTATEIAYGDGMLFVTNGSDGWAGLYAVDAASGTERWRFHSDVALSAPVVAGDLVYVGTSPFLAPPLPDGAGRFHAVATATGEERWGVDLSISSTPAVVDGVVYVHTGGFAAPSNHLRALDAATGRERWATDRDAAVYAAPAVAEGIVYVAGGKRDDASFRLDDVYLAAVDAATGRERWRLPVDETLGGTPAVLDGALYLTAYEGALFALGDVAPAAGTPAATPVVGDDVSGRVPCAAEPSPDPIAAGLSGTPRAALDRDTFGPDGPSETELPTGDPAPAATVAEIEDVLRAFAACADAEPARRFGFFSDDYFRPFAAVGDDRADFAIVEWSVSPFADVTPRDARVLPDGRVGAIVEGGYNPAFVLFVDAGDRWLIDELLVIPIFPEPDDIATPTA